MQSPVCNAKQLTFFAVCVNLKSMKDAKTVSKKRRGGGLYRFFAVSACLLFVVGAVLFVLAVYIGLSGKSPVLFGVDLKEVRFLGVIVNFIAEYQMFAYVFFALAIILSTCVIAVGRIGKEIVLNVKHEEIIIANARLEARREIENKFYDDCTDTADEYRYEVFSEYFDNRS